MSADTLTHYQRSALLYEVATTEDPFGRNELATKIVAHVQAREGLEDATFTRAVLEQAEDPTPDPNTLLCGVLAPGVDPNHPDTINAVRAVAQSVLK